MESIQDIKNGVIVSLNSLQWSEKFENRKAYIEKCMEKVNSTDLDVILISFFLNAIDNNIDLDQLFISAPKFPNQN